MRGGHRIGTKGSLTSEAKRKLRLSSCTSKLLLTGRLVPFTRRMGLSSTIPCQEAITNQAKPNPSSSSSSRKPRAKSGKNKTKSQETSTY